MKQCPYCGAPMKEDEEYIPSINQTPQVKPLGKTGQIMTAKKRKTYRPENFDNEWQKKRAVIIRRDNYTCMRCGSTPDQDKLTVHHIKTRAKGGGDYSANLITLCPRCHDYVEVRDLNSAAEIIGSFPDPFKEVDTGSNIRSKFEDVRYRPSWSGGKKEKTGKPSYQRLYGPIYEICQMVAQGYKFNGVKLHGKAFDFTIPKQ